VRTKSRVLVIDDEPAIGQVLNAALSARGFDVRVAIDGTEGLEAASMMEPDVMIVDLGLPDLDGVNVCRHLRRWTANPIIVLTVEDEDRRKVEALDAGADDYVTKPFSTPELLARVRVAMRHRNALAQVVDPVFVRVGNLVLDTATHEVRLGGELLELTRKEFALLAVLSRNAGRVLTHQALISAVWDGDDDRTGRLRAHVTQLRAKLGRDGGSVRIVTEPGVGYRLVATRADAEALDAP
jgi:two-component system, OmpR family, KDP operon response regulator KdpE